MSFNPVSSRVEIQKLEAEQMQFWRDREIFKRTVSERDGAEDYVFYEGPPTANGKPGIHHVLARSFKDLFPRYKTMRGFRVQRKGGWDTHGLPVEIQVEKALGIKQKREIEEYGVAAFNEKCRESVLEYLDEWQKLTERMGYWVDLEHAYVTFKNEYIESIWAILKQFSDDHLLYQDYKVVPYCPRCGTPLSTHEVSDSYKDVDDPSVYVRFPLKDQQNTSILAWTTTPWTLPNNVALAVGTTFDYVTVEGPDPRHPGQTERLILAEELFPKVIKNHADYQIVARQKGSELIGQHYDPPFGHFPLYGLLKTDYAFVISAPHVTLESGTGVVHMSPSFGAEDMEATRAAGIGMLHSVKRDGTFIEQVTDFAGQWVKEADKGIIRDLKTRGLLYAQQQYHHSYPHCWRCGTPLLYYALDTWYLRTTQFKDQLIGLNQTINWTPEHVRDGRFGMWLENVRDWAIGRNRYWGTPLPVWKSDDPTSTQQVTVGSLKELSQYVGRDLTGLDLHRPYVDEITWPSADGKGTMRRVPELIDVWFDSGAMPYAQWGYPHVPGSDAQFESQFPADYICEAVDQTRGWFYSLHAIATMLKNSVAYKNVICLGHILDENGFKMSKSRGNIVNPWEIMDANGADAARWYMYTAAPPGDSRRFSKNLVNEVISGFYLTLWNTYSFFVTYANLDKYDPSGETVPLADRDELDRWIISELHTLVKRVTNAYENYDVTNATRPIQYFVEDLSNWYIRRSRRRFWSEGQRGMTVEKRAAYQTLHECLLTLSKLLAPAMPFMADSMYRNLAQHQQDFADSVHLAQWPTYDEAQIDSDLMAYMGLAKRLVSLGHAARSSVNLKVRQPLAEASFAVLNSREAEAVESLKNVIAEELNVKSVTLMGMSEAGGMVTYALNPLPQKLGKRLGGAFPKIQRMLREGNQSTVAAYAKTLLGGESITVTLDGESYSLTSEEVEVRRNATEGYTVEEANGYVAALKTALTDELIAEGMAREVIRRVNMMRRDADFALNDQIEIAYEATPRLAEALTTHAEYVKNETLARELRSGNGMKTSLTAEIEFDGEKLSVQVQRVG